MRFHQFIMLKLAANRCIVKLFHTAKFALVTWLAQNADMAGYLYAFLDTIQVPTWSNSSTPDAGQFLQACQFTGKTI